MTVNTLSFRESRDYVRQHLKALTATRVGENILLAVTGYVASGKSRFCAQLRTDAEVILHRPFLYLPFDLWINTKSLDARQYAGRFFMKDLIEAVRCIRRGESFLVPRYDIAKTIGPLGSAVQLSSQEVLWNGKTFRQCGMRVDAPPIDGHVALYAESLTGYPYSLVSPPPESCLLLDGTLVVPSEARSLYDLAVFVEASWPLRVARMIRRYNRKEVFGTTKQAMSDYVGFLVSEARECADAEIRAQRDAATILVESVPETLSNYLDLVYLRGCVSHGNIVGGVNPEEVDAAMETFLQQLRHVHDPDLLAKFRDELVVLMESKHLLALPDADPILGDLAHILLQ